MKKKFVLNFTMLGLIASMCEFSRADDGYRGGPSVRYFSGSMEDSKPVLVAVDGSGTLPNRIRVKILVPKKFEFPKEPNGVPEPGPWTDPCDDVFGRHQGIE